MYFFKLNQSGFTVRRLVVFFVLLLFFTKEFSPIFSQTDGRFSQIEELLEQQNYTGALAEARKEEVNYNYKTNTTAYHQLNLLKATALHGLDSVERAVDILLDKFDILSVNREFTQYATQYSLLLGTIFSEADNYKKSIDYYRIALQKSMFDKDTVNILKSNLEIGKNYAYSSKNNIAKIYFKRIIDFPENEVTQSYLSVAYNNLANLVSNDNLPLAEKYYNKSFEILKSQKDTVGLATGMINLGGIYFEKQEYEKAITVYLNALETIEDVKTESALQTKEYALYNLAYANKMVNNFKDAYSYLEQATNLTEGLSSRKVSENLAEIEAKYNVAKQAQAVEEEKSKRFRTQVLLYSAVFAFVVFLILFYIVYRNYKLKQRSKIESLENELQIKLINAAIDAKEKERKSIASILHDSVSALLSSVNLHLQASKSQFSQTTPTEISKAQDIVNEASVKIRDLSHELVSPVLLKFGLAFAINDICQKYSNTELSLKSNDKNIERYDQDFEIKIYNIIEELINNILKHSKATEANIILLQIDNNVLTIRIIDNGIGFDTKAAKNKDGLGLSHINARVKAMKGIFTVESTTQKGTSIFIKVPIKHKE